MANPFATESMAAGYANSRPPVHRLVIQRAFRQLDRTRPFSLALDIGCGAGVSTKALAGFADRCIGLEPNQSMLAWSPAVALLAAFLCASAEAIPLRDHSVDLITAAGSLNYVDLDLFFPQAARVLTPDGILIVYDFSPGRSFRAAAGLDEWFSEFSRLYPPPASETRDLSPEILEDVASGFRLRAHEYFEVALPLTAGFYVDYMMTETNVAAAIRRGEPASEIESWCTRTLQPIWRSPEHEVLFRGYFACMEVQT